MRRYRFGVPRTATRWFGAGNRENHDASGFLLMTEALGYPEYVAWPSAGSRPVTDATSPGRDEGPALRPGLRSKNAGGD